MTQSQTTRMIRLMQRPQGATNWELSRISLKYSSRIAEIRQDGTPVYPERQKLPNGRYSNTWKYYIVPQHEPQGNWAVDKLNTLKRKVTHG